MTETPWLIRVCQKKDAKLLEGFRCAQGDAVWQIEVEQYIRKDLLKWAFAPFAKPNDPRLLLVFGRTSNSLIGLAAHEKCELRVGNGRSFPASKLEVIAVATRWQGQQFKTGERMSDVVMSAALHDISARVPPRDARVFAVVHQDNVRSIALCKRHGLSHELSRPHLDYRRLISASRDVK